MVTVLPYTSASTLSQTCSVIYRATAAKILDDHQLVSPWTEVQ